MIQTIRDARATLENHGLTVAENDATSLLIGGWIADGGDGVRVFKDACGLNQMNGEWVVLFPADGIQQYEIPGTLADGVALVLSAYAEHRQHGGRFRDACKRVLKGADPHPVGRSLAAV